MLVGGFCSGSWSIIYLHRVRNMQKGRDVIWEWFSGVRLGLSLSYSLNSCYDSVGRIKGIIGRMVPATGKFKVPPTRVSNLLLPTISSPWEAFPELI